MPLLVVVIWPVAGPAGAAGDQPAAHIERFHPQEMGLSWADHFTRAVRSRGRLVHIAPIGATDALGRIVGKSDIEAQARHIYRKLMIALASAGAGPADVVMHRTYVVGLKPEYGPILARLMREFYPRDARPAAALIGIGRLIDPDLMLEIEVTAVVADPAS